MKTLNIATLKSNVLGFGKKYPTLTIAQIEAEEGGIRYLDWVYSQILAGESWTRKLPKWLKDLAEANAEELEARKQEKIEENRQNSTSEYYGVIGKTYSFELAIREIKTYKGKPANVWAGIPAEPDTHIAKATDGMNEYSFYCELGKYPTTDTFMVRARVKDHVEISGVKVTKLHYVKLEIPKA